MATADLDGDGDTDVLATDYYGLAWYENDEDGSFSDLQHIITSDLANSDAQFHTGDLDGDGDVDVFGGNGSNRIVWFENNGSGSFGDVQLISKAVVGLNAVRAADLDDDGDLDLLSASATDETIAWYENDGNGGFGEQQVIFDQATGYSGFDVSVYATDLDRDGDSDVLATYDRGTIAWFESSGDGTFGEQHIVTTTSPFASPLSVADLDGDADPDIVAGSQAANRVTWYENDGSGRFGDGVVIDEHPDVGHNDKTSSVHVIDFDGDGDADVLAAFYRRNEVVWYVNDGHGTFAEQRVITQAAYYVTSALATDLDADGHRDVLWSQYQWWPGDNTGRIAWHKNDGGTFDEPRFIFPAVTRPTAVQAADLDADSDVDVLVASCNDNKVAWYENDGTGGFGRQHVITAEAGCVFSVDTADLNGDGDLDVLSASMDDEVAWYENEGAGVFGEQQVIDTAFGGASTVRAADLDRDGDADVVSAHAWTTARGAGGGVAWFENDGTGNFGDGTHLPTRSTMTWNADVADLDGDGDLDVLSASWKVISSEPAAEVKWNENDGTGTFASEQIFSTARRSSNVVATATDLDGDEDLDVVSTSSDGSIVWNENDGTGGLGIQHHIGAGNNTMDAATATNADLDGDGDDDVIAAFHEFGGRDRSTVLVWYENDGTGTFSSAAPLATTADSYDEVALHPADVDGDGDPDLLVASDANLIAWYENRLDVTTATEEPPDGRGFALDQNAPNPFTGRTTIRFATGRPGRVTLQVFDLLGRQVAVLVDSDLPAGRHEAELETSNLPSGIYLYRLTSMTSRETRRMVVAK